MTHTATMTYEYHPGCYLNLHIFVSFRTCTKVFTQRSCTTKSSNLDRYVVKIFMFLLFVVIKCVLFWQTRNKLVALFRKTDFIWYQIDVLNISRDILLGKSYIKAVCMFLRRLLLGEGINFKWFVFTSKIIINAGNPAESAQIDW